MRSRPGRLTCGAVAVVALLLSAGCGTSDKSAEDTEADLSAALQDHDGFDKAAADCFAGILVAELGADEVQDVNFADDAPSEELGEDFAAAAAIAAEECDLPSP